MICDRCKEEITKGAYINLSNSETRIFKSGEIYICTYCYDDQFSTELNRRPRNESNIK
jgi:hypothetical protein